MADEEQNVQLSATHRMGWILIVGGVIALSLVLLLAFRVRTQVGTLRETSAVRSTQS